MEKKLSDIQYDVAVIGGGPAGIAAAIAAADENAKVILIERDICLGGILNQCIHLGFGLINFNEDLTGPEYAHRYIQMLNERNIDVILNTMVLSVDSDRSVLHVINPEKGNTELKAKAIVLAMGCRERTRMALLIPGTRPAGIFTAGVAQRFLNIQNYKIGKKIVILGSGDIGMIMARRLTLENADVVGVVEIMPYLTGLTRNKVQCLDDFDIPLYLSHTIIDIKGLDRVNAVTIAKVDENLSPVFSTARDIECDTVLFSVGLIPENELSKKCGVAINPQTGGPFVNQYLQTNKKNIFSCGNVLHVNDIVDNVSDEGSVAGKNAALFAAEKLVYPKRQIVVKPGSNVSYVIPNLVKPDETLHDFIIYTRILEPMREVYVSAAVEGCTVNQKKIERASPGEMISLTINMKKLLACKGEELVVSIEKGGETGARAHG